MTTLSLLKNGKEFGKLEVRLLFGHKLDPCAHEEWLRKTYADWSKNIDDHQDRINTIVASEVSSIYGSMFPDCPRERLLVVAKCIDVLAYSMDGYKKCLTIDHVSDLTTKLLQMLQTGQCDDTKFTLGRRLLEALAAIEPDINANQKSYLRSALKNSFRAEQHIHNKYRLVGKLIDFDDYYTVRSAQSGWGYCLSLVEYIAGHSIPESVRYNEYVLRFYGTSVRLGLAVEDYLMCRTKLATNDPMCGVLSYAFSNKCTVQSALDYYHQYIQGLDNESKSLAQTIGDHQELGTKEMSKYLQCVREMPSGFEQMFAKLLDFQYKDGVISCQIWDQISQTINESMN